MWYAERNKLQGQSRSILQAKKRTDRRTLKSINALHTSVSFKLLLPPRIRIGLIAVGAQFVPHSIITCTAQYRASIWTSVGECLHRGRMNKVQVK